jgi:hypothetical protein
MIARHRGDQRIHSRWRPRPSQSTPPADPPARATEETQLPSATDDAPRRIPWRKPSVLISVALLLLALAVGVRQATTSGSARLALPQTTALWVQQFTAAAIDNPADVCNRLFAPALAAVFKRDTGRSCLAYYRRVDSRSYRIRHTLQDGPSAAIEGQELGYSPTFGYFTILLTHLQTGWQAIDIVPGASARAR